MRLLITLFLAVLLIEDALADFDVPGKNVTLRLSREEPYITDEGHYILDLHLHRIKTPQALSLVLNQIPGVVENGLFTDIADAVCVGYPSGEAKILTAAEG